MNERERLWASGPWEPQGDMVVFEYKTYTTPLAHIKSDYRVDNKEATAQLISAAPDLVDALEILLKLHDNEVFTKDAWESAMDKARAAVDKAYGDSGQ